MNVSSKIYLFILGIYIISSSILSIFLNEMVQYIINPLIWMLFAIVGAVFYQKKYIQQNKEIIYDVLISTMLYIALFYTLGFFIGFSNNAYSKDRNGIIINLFSILLIVGLKEWIRAVFLGQIKSHKLLFQGIIFFLFFLSDLPILSNLEIGTYQGTFFKYLFEFIIPAISLNLYSNYLCIKSGFFASFLFRIGIVGSTLLLPIIPKFDSILPTVFQVFVPLFTYLVIRYQTKKREKYNLEEPIKPSKWIPAFLFILFLLFFFLGMFSIRPIVILTGSMRPTILEGDLLLMKDCRFEQVKIGDIIEYSNDHYTVVHRVLNRIEDKDGIKLIMKGDNNQKEDHTVVTPNNFVSCYVFKIPYLGYPAYLVRQIIGKQEVSVETGR